MHNILVTGGAGFIGSHVCEALLKQNHTVTCVDNFSTGTHENIKHLKTLKIIEGDTNNAKTWEGLAKQTFDTVFHYAATVGVKRTEENPLAVLADIDGLRHLATFAQTGHTRKIIFASSSEVYGEPKHVPEKETEGYCAWSPYTTVKLFGEHILSSLWQEEKIPTISLRFFNVYGPRQRGNAYGFVTAQFIQQALQGMPLTIHGDGQQTRDFVYVDDNVATALALHETEQAHGQIINIGTGSETTINQLAQTIIDSTDTNGQFTYTSARIHDIRRRCADVTKLKNIIKTSLPTKLAHGIKETIAWYHAERNETVPVKTATVPASVQ